MAFTSELSPSEYGSGRRASNTSFEAWLPHFSGLHRPKGIEALTPYDQFLFTPSSASPTNPSPLSLITPWQNMKSVLLQGGGVQRIDVLGKGRDLIFHGIRKRSVFHPVSPPVYIYDTNFRKVLNVDSFKGLRCLWDNSMEVQILSSSGMIGLIRLTSMDGVRAYEILDSYSQIAFYITPNLAPHSGLQLLILGAERSLLTGAILEGKNDEFSLEVFKPLSPSLKALLVSFSIFIIFSNVRSHYH